MNATATLNPATATLRELFPWGEGAPVLTTRELARRVGGTTYDAWVGALGYSDLPLYAPNPADPHSWRHLPVTCRYQYADGRPACVQPGGNVQELLKGAPAGAQVMERVLQGCHHVESVYWTRLRSGGWVGEWVSEDGR